jgi:hypothetical protein
MDTESRDTILGIIGLTLLLIGFGGFTGLMIGERVGWKDAYEAYHQDTLENRAKKRFPKLWIKYNIDNPKEQKEQNESYDRP